MAIAAAGVSLALGYKQQQQQDIAQRRQASAQKKAAAAERRSAELSNARQRRAMSEQARVEQAANIAGAFATGGQGSSSVVGANMSIQSGLSGAIASQNQKLAANSVVSYNLQRGQDQYASHMKKAGNYGALSQASMGAAPYMPEGG